MLAAKKVRRRLAMLFHAKAQRRKAAKIFLLDILYRLKTVWQKKTVMPLLLSLCLFAPWRLCVSLSLLRSNNQKLCMKERYDKPPLFNSWTHWYVLVIVFLIALILFFTFFTKTFA